MAKSKKNNKRNNNNTKVNTHQQDQGGIRKSYRIGALILCAVIVVSLVAMYAFI